MEMQEHFQLGFETGRKLEQTLALFPNFSPVITKIYMRGLQQSTTPPRYGLTGQLGCEVPGPSTEYGIGRGCEVPFPGFYPRGHNTVERLAGTFSREEFETPEDAAQVLARTIDVYEKLEGFVQQYPQLKLDKDPKVEKIQTGYRKMVRDFHETCYTNTILTEHLQGFARQYPELKNPFPPFCERWRKALVV